MKKRHKVYYGKISDFLIKKIYINVNHLEKGDYEINIVHRNKIIKKFHFRRR